MVVPSRFCPEQGRHTRRTWRLRMGKSARRGLATDASLRLACALSPLWKNESVAKTVRGGLLSLALACFQIRLANAFETVRRPTTAVHLVILAGALRLTLVGLLSRLTKLPRGNVDGCCCCCCFFLFPKFVALRLSPLRAESAWGVHRKTWRGAVGST